MWRQAQFYTRIINLAFCPLGQSTVRKAGNFITKPCLFIKQIVFFYKKRQQHFNFKRLWLIENTALKLTVSTPLLEVLVPSNTKNHKGFHGHQETRKIRTSLKIAMLGRSDKWSTISSIVPGERLGTLPIEPQVPLCHTQ